MFEDPMAVLPVRRGRSNVVGAIMGYGMLDSKPTYDRRGKTNLQPLQTCVHDMRRISTKNGIRERWYDETSADGSCS